MKYPKNQFKLYSSVFAAVALFAIMSCSPAKNDSKQPTQLPEQQQSKEETSSVNIETEANTSENTNVTDEEIAEPASETADQQTTEENNEKVMINPPHGQPGHRCEIPVGQPLSAAPADNTAPTIANNPNEQVMINPPHGQPGHRCDIPVGQPLNSPPENNAVQVTTPQTSDSEPSVANNPTAPTIENAMRMNSTQTRSTTPANSGSKPRLNPAHGQPGHRCDIAVGSPLP